MREKKKITVEEFYPTKNIIVFSDDNGKAMGSIAPHERSKFDSIKTGDVLSVEIVYGKDKRNTVPSLLMSN